MLVDQFPLVGLTLRTPRLELRLPSPEELAALASLAAQGIHEPGACPFLTPWTENPPEEVARSVVLYHWRELGAFTAQKWHLNLTVFHDGEVVGQQDISGTDFPVTRQVNTGSWLGRRHQGNGIGTEMRAAVLQLAFEGLGAEVAASAAMVDNPASLGVSRKLGYVPNGLGRNAVQGGVRVDQKLLLTREAWEQHRTVPVAIEGLEPCLPLLGLKDS